MCTYMNRMILALVALTSAQAAIFYTVEDASIGSLATKIIRNVLTGELNHAYIVRNTLPLTLL